MDNMFTRGKFGMPNVNSGASSIHPTLSNLMLALNDIYTNAVFDPNKMPRVQPVCLGELQLLRVSVPHDDSNITATYLLSEDVNINAMPLREEGKAPETLISGHYEQLDNLLKASYSIGGVEVQNANSYIVTLPFGFKFTDPAALQALAQEAIMRPILGNAMDEKFATPNSDDGPLEITMAVELGCENVSNSVGLPVRSDIVLTLYTTERSSKRRSEISESKMELATIRGYTDLSFVSGATTYMPQLVITAIETEVPNWGIEALAWRAIREFINSGLLYRALVQNGNGHKLAAVLNDPSLPLALHDELMHIQKQNDEMVVNHMLFDLAQRNFQGFVEVFFDINGDLMSDARSCYDAIHRNGLDVFYKYFDQAGRGRMSLIHEHSYELAGYMVQGNGKKIDTRNIDYLYRLHEADFGSKLGVVEADDSKAHSAPRYGYRMKYSLDVGLLKQEKDMEQAAEDAKFEFYRTGVYRRYLVNGDGLRELTHMVDQVMRPIFTVCVVNAPAIRKWYPAAPMKIGAV